ncbi:hypothetical protein CYMTET_8755 [Cymbomonas tetramitiformis]|uniref:Photosynthesis system II assembly factor Ycf48/Hcf136-like domain-containing protein n=1 Tax=Cymbomonas tetramitiformis TaxID=36881 RepID=A0AAE0GSD8_9CHLO|nr:hypothetical protein CYMTET_8755 [Cymbomonas tetramitiformis]
MDASNVLVVGEYGLILKTWTGGDAWHRMNSTTPAHLYGIHCVDLLVCYVVGMHATLLNTIDGGYTWTSLEIPAAFLRLRTSGLTRAAFLRLRTSGLTRAAFLRLRTSGLTRAAFLRLRTSGLTRAAFLRLRTSGLTRAAELRSGLVLTPNDCLQSIFFTDDMQHGWAVGLNATIVYTGDYGTTWVRQELCSQAGTQLGFRQAAMGVCAA